MGHPGCPGCPILSAGSARREDVRDRLQLGVGLDGLGPEVARQLLRVVAHHILELRDLVRLELLTGLELVRELGPVHGVRGHPAPAVLVDGGLRLVLVVGLARRHDDGAGERELGVLRDAGLDLGLGEEGVEVGHVVNAPDIQTVGASVVAAAHPPRSHRPAPDTPSGARSPRGGRRGITASDHRAHHLIRAQGPDLRNDATRHDPGSLGAARVFGGMIKPILTLAFFVSGAALLAVALQRPTSAPPVASGDVVLGPVAVSPVVLPETVVVASPRLAVASPRRERPATRREFTRPLEPCWTPAGSVRVWDTQL